MFKLDVSKGIGDTIKGWIVRPIQYEVRVPNGDWSPWFGDYNQQKWGSYDSNSCWCLSQINGIEDQLEWLVGHDLFSTEALKFFYDNEYIDSDGDFSISERYIEILSGAHDNGNSQMEALRLAQIYGLIPRELLSYTDKRANRFLTKEDFNADYFNQAEITDDMRRLGTAFLSHVNISRQWIGKLWYTPTKEVLKAALKQAPLDIGIPVPRNVSNWNKKLVNYDGKKSADHAVELYFVDDSDFPYYIFDQYEPHLKRLSKDYYIPVCTQAILSAIPFKANPIPQDGEKSFWTAVMNYWNNIFSKIPIGRTAET